MPPTINEDMFGFTTVVRKRRARMIEKVKLLPPVPKEPIDRPTIRATRRDFTPSLTFSRPTLNDELLDAAKYDLHHYNLSTLKRFHNALNISPLSDAIHPLPNGMPNIRLCAIGNIEGDGRAGFMAKVPIYGVRDAAGEACVMVLESRKSTRFSEWLDLLARPEASTLVGEEGYELQCRWWRKRGGRFAFDELPLDLKSIVMLHVVGEVRNCDFEDGIEFSFDLGHDYHSVKSRLNEYKQYGTSDPTRIPTIREVDPHLFTWSETFGLNLRKLIDYNTIKHFSSPPHLLKAVAPSRSGILRLLTRIQLDFSDNDFLHFFGACLPDYRHWLPGPETNPSATAISELPDLKYLELWFRSTIKGQRYPCRKQAIDTIMWFAYRHVKHIKTVNLTGYIKTETRLKWLQILKDKRNTNQHHERIDDMIAQAQGMDTKELYVLILFFTRL